MFNKWITSATFALFVSLCLLGIGCSEQPDQTQPPCGEGDELEVANASYCVYRGEIIETGFECPPEYPNRSSYGDFEVCSAEENLPDEFPDRMEEEYDDEALPQDGCVRDYMCAALEECQAGECVAVPCEQDAECMDGEVCLQGECLEETGLNVCEDDFDCERFDVCVDGYCIEDPDLPDTSDERFEGTECHDRDFVQFDRRYPNCRGNTGCTRFEVECGQSQCELCADEYCLSEAVNDCDWGFDAGSEDAGRTDADADGG